MSDPKPYDLSKLEELFRLVHEVYGYLKVSVDDGTDRDGRRYALDALRRIEALPFSAALTGKLIANMLHSAPPATTEPCCASCKFVVREGPDNCCHRYPPAWAGTGGSPQWHRVADTDFCGEHRPKDEGDAGDE